MGFYTDTVTKDEALIYVTEQTVLIPDKNCNRLIYVDLEGTELEERQSEKSKSTKLEKNLFNIREALSVLTEIVLLDEYPNSIKSKDRKFYMYSRV